MEYRVLGRTGDKVSTIGMGTWKMGASVSEEERRNQVQALRRGVELGINFIDTAEMYAGGGAERLVGQAVGDIRDSVLIATKVSPGHLHRDDVIDSCRRSLERLGVRSVDLYQVHWPNPAVPIKETMAAMEQLVRDGKVRHIGVSNFSVTQTKEAQESLGREELVSNQVEYSLAARSVEADLLPFAEKEGITVIAYSPLGQGKLPAHLVPPSVSAKYGMTPAQVILNWVTFRKNVIAIPKSASLKHVEENAASVSSRLSPEDYAAVSASNG